MNNDILDLLGIGPKETHLAKAIHNQLQALFQWGLIEPTTGGWRWVE